MLPLLPSTLHRLLPIQHRTIPNPLQKANLIPKIVQRTIPTASSVYIPLPISITKKYEFFWGYKNHVIVYCISGLPLCELTTTAEVADHTVAPKLLENTNNVISIRECTLIADKGFDVKVIYNTVKNVYDRDCVIPLNPRNKKNPKMTAVGNIVCEAGFTMHKDGKDSFGGRCRQKYCRPFKNSKDDTACTCAHKNCFNGKKNCGCTKYVTLPDDYRLSIDRSCISFKRIYAMRTELKRYNARFKNTGQEWMWVRSFNSTQNLSTIAPIALLAVTTAAVITKRPALKLSLNLLCALPDLFSYRFFAHFSVGFFHLRAFSSRSLGVLISLISLI